MHSKPIHLLTASTLLLLAISATDIAAQCPVEPSGFAGGDGSRDNPFQICSVEQLSNMRNNRFASYVLIADIDLAEAGGTTSPTASHNWDPIERFSGIFDGDGHEIRNLKITLGESEVGFFRRTSSGAAILNVNIVNAAVKGGDLFGERNENYTGVVAGRNSGLIQRVSVVGTVKADETIGGIVGWNEADGRINNCSFGGILDGRNTAGGVAGYSEGDITFCTANDVDIATEDSFAGGIAGLVKNGLISHCLASGEITGKSASGGLIGSLEENSSISNSGSTCTVSGFEYLGGLIGTVIESSVDSSYATGTVNAEYDSAGLVASVESSSVSNCYAACAVTSRYNPAGLVENSSSDATFTGLFWDIEANGLETGAYGRSAALSNPEIVGLTTEEMMTRASFDAAWDFCSNWGIDEGNDYPRLLIEFQKFPSYDETMYPDDGNCAIPAPPELKPLENELPPFVTGDPIGTTLVDPVIVIDDVQNSADFELMSALTSGMCGSGASMLVTPALLLVASRRRRIR